MFTGALKLWRGRPFEDIADEPWAAAEVRRLEASRTACQEDLVDALLAGDRTVEALAVVDQLVATDPFNESHRLRKARTLYRAGRANDALEALREFRAQIAEELGIDPLPTWTGSNGRSCGTTPISAADGKFAVTSSENDSAVGLPVRSTRRDGQDRTRRWRSASIPRSWPTTPPS